MTDRVRNQIRERRLARGWTQQELAQAASVSRQSINSIESGRYVPSLPLALRFAQLFDCSLDHLFALDTADGSPPP